MTTLKLLLPYLIIIATCLYASGLHVSTKPLNIKMTAPLFGLGIFLVIIGAFMIYGSVYSQGIKEGMKIQTEAIKGALDDAIVHWEVEAKKAEGGIQKDTVK